MAGNDVNAEKNLPTGRRIYTARRGEAISGA